MGKTLELNDSNFDEAIKSDKPVLVDQLESILREKANASADASCVIREDNTLPVQVIVDVISMGTNLKLKMILATDKK